MIVSAYREIVSIPTANCHASTLATVGDRVLLAWFGGTAEGEPDVDIYLSRRENGMWSAPYAVASREGVPHWNPVLFVDGDDISLYYKTGDTIAGWRTCVVRSSDGGLRFGASSELVPGDIGGRGPVRNPILRLSNGRLLAPASVETPTRWNAFVDISEDAGRTFRKSAFVPVSRPEAPLPEPAYPVQGKGVIQPTLWQSADGSVHMLLRSTEGWLLRSDSYDLGETWSPARSSGLPNNNSGVCMARLADGRLALLMNPVSGNWASRSPLSLYLSQDDGESFRLAAHLEMEPGEYSYPCAVAQGNTLHISYTWRRLAVAYWRIDFAPVG